MIRLYFFLSFTIFASCSSVSFVSSNKIPVSLDYNDGKISDVSLSLTRSFYMWGLYPKSHRIEIDKEFESKGLKEVSDLTIVEIDENVKAMWMLITFGMYYPQTFKLTAKAN